MEQLTRKRDIINRQIKSWTQFIQKFDGNAKVRDLVISRKQQLTEAIQDRDELTLKIEYLTKNSPPDLGKTNI